MKRYTLHNGDNREVLKTFEDNSIDSIVCDPPYELGFMGKKWDSTGIAYNVALWAECLRVLKPGGHLLAFGGSRTYHRMAVAIEDAGFEIRDCIMWLYSSGFPKSHDVSKALDKHAGAEREVVDIKQRGSVEKALAQGVGYLSDPANKNNKKQFGYGTELITAPATDLAKQWQGWGTALKPAHEPIVVARKPLQGTVADNVQAWGVGALNIDGCRVGSDDAQWTRHGTADAGMWSGKKRIYQENITSGRWPANIIFDEEAAQMLDEQSGGASRFFYIPKASRAEREAGLDAPDGQRGNIHATVKPIALMRYLVRMVTPRGGVVLDSFMGSGTTGCAAMLEGVRFIGIELNEEYSGIAERRIRYWMSQNMMGI